MVTLLGWDRFAKTLEIESTLRQAHVGLMLAEPDPNYVVSIPTKFYEYLQYGLPILVSDIPLWSRFVDQTRAGAAVPPDDLDAVLG